MSYTDILQDNIPISFLEPLVEKNDEMLFLVSVPNSDTATGYISKCIKLSDIVQIISSELSVPAILTKLNLLSSYKFESDVICCDVESPYIISSIAQDTGSITEVGGYRLKTGIEQVFKTSTINSKIENNAEVKTNKLSALSVYANALICESAKLSVKGQGLKIEDNMIELSTATSTRLGGIKVGNNLKIYDGKLCADIDISAYRNETSVLNSDILIVKNLLSNTNSHLSVGQLYDEFYKRMYNQMYNVISAKIVSDILKDYVRKEDSEGE